MDALFVPPLKGTNCFQLTTFPLNKKGVNSLSWMNAKKFFTDNIAMRINLFKM